MDDMTAKFAKAILARRKQLGLTQEELAERVGTTKQVVSKYENGQRSPKVIMANAFAAALETTLDELLDVEKVEPVLMQSAEEEYAKNQDIRILVKQLNSLSPEQLQQAKNVFRAMFAITNPELFEGDDNDAT